MGQLGQDAVSRTPHDAQDATLSRIAELISDITTARTRWEKECRILDRLKFNGMRQRENAIEPARAGTYRWLLYPPTESPPAATAQQDQLIPSETEPEDSMSSFMSNLRQLNKASVKYALSPPQEGKVGQLNAETGARFLNWLESGSGIFYISGKAGSGKSTAMKFLTRDQRTLRALRSWAGRKQLAFASFFFWKQDLALQRSVEGLYRSLLWETLRLFPELIPTLFPSAWGRAPGGPLQVPLSDTEFLLSELEEAFERLVTLSGSLPGCRLCFFIDGLDEFEGDHGKLASLLRGWAACPDVKLCVSSRPDSEVETSIAAPPKQSLRLHEHTYPDMILVAQDEVNRAREHGTSSSCRLDCMALIRSAVKKADGVFLWLRLVMRHLVRGIKNAYSAPQLADMLHCIPEDVSAMFHMILDKLLARQENSRVAITLLSLSDPVLLRPEGHYVMHFAAMDDYLDGRIGNEEVVARGRTALRAVYSADRIEGRLADAEAQLRGRCEDFIDIHDNPDSKDLPIPLRRYVSLVHRDARDFLSQNHINEKLRDIAGYTPSRLDSLSRVLGLVLLKTVPPIKLADEIIDDFYHSESTSMTELDAVMSILLEDKETGFTSTTTRERYCSILALRDHIPGRQLSWTVDYDPSNRIHRDSRTTWFLTAAAFHRHEGYVLHVVEHVPVLHTWGLTSNLLLSASLGGAAALAAFIYPISKENGVFAGNGPRNPWIECIAGCSLDSGGLATLLYPEVADELFPESAPIDQTFDTPFKSDGFGRPVPRHRAVRRGGADPLSLARALLQKGISPNTRLTQRLPVAPWSGSYWTPWTTVLLSLAAVIRKGELLDDVFLDLA